MNARFDPNAEAARWFHQGVALHREGDWPRAIEAYRQSLRLGPGHPAVLHNLGVALLLSGQDVNEALDCLRKAVEIKPDSEGFLAAYVDALLQSDRKEDVGRLLEIAASRGFRGQAWDTRARALQASDDPQPVAERRREQAELQQRAQQWTQWFTEGAFDQIVTDTADYLAERPQTLVALKARGAALGRLERWEDSAQALEAALALDPEDDRLLRNLAAAWMQLGRLHDAENLCRKVVSLKPDQTEPLCDLSAILIRRNQLAEAEQLLQRALARDKHSARAAVMLADLWADARRLPEAQSLLREVLERDPDYFDALTRMTLVLERLGRLGEAEAMLQRAEMVDAAHPEVQFARGTVRTRQGRMAEAYQAFLQMVTLRPRALNGWSMLLYASNFISGLTSAFRRQQAQQYGASLNRQVGRVSRVWRLPQGQRLRIGLVSGDFRQHPVGFFLDGVLPALDPAQVELIAYPTVPDRDDLTEHLRGYFAAWTPIHGLDDASAAERIWRDGINVLIDLSGHTTYQRLGVFAHRPAPVQVSWPGYFATTGVQQMDWFIADRDCVPDALQEQFTEKVFYLPTRLCFTPPLDAPEVSPLPALKRDGQITFGCFQTLGKVTDAVLQSWSRVLAAVPGSRLRFQAKALGEQASVESLLQRAELAGIDRSRIECHAATDRLTYLQAHDQVDLVLDTFPYNGGTTTCEALWMGVPTITFTGETLIARQGASMLRAAGLGDWVAEDLAGYEALAIRWAQDVTGLARVRAGLRQQVVGSVLFDTPRFARTLEAALREMWQQALGSWPGSSWQDLNNLQEPEDQTQARQDVLMAHSHDQLESWLAMYRAERFAELLADLDRYLAQDNPALALAWKIKGLAHMRLDQSLQAEAAFHQALQTLTHDPELQGNLGAVLCALERYQDALVPLQDAIRLDPTGAEWYHLLAVALLHLGRHDECEHAVDQALVLDPHIRPASWLKLQCEAGRGEWQKAVARLEHLRKESTSKDLSPYWELMAQCYGNANRHADALECIDTALAEQPDRSKLLGQRALALSQLGRYPEALEASDRALTLHPESAEIWAQRGMVYGQMGASVEAVACQSEAVRLNPQLWTAHSARLFGLNYLADAGRVTEAFEAACFFGRALAETVTDIYTEWRAQASERLKVGVVSGDLRRHPVGFFLDGVLPAFDSTKIELVGYPTVPDRDDLTEHLRGYFSEWTPINGLDGPTAAERIWRDGVHVLIDMSGHTAYNRLDVFARRPAPVQVSWPGYFATTGVRQMDWFIADHDCVPEGLQSQFTERIWYLPTRLCFTPPLDAPEVSPLPALQRGGQITFGCFQAMGKVTDAVLQSWSRILKAVPQSRLRFQAKPLGDEAGVESLLQRAESAGIGRDRIECHGVTNRQRYLRAHADVDLVLDTFPYNGGTTTCEALWMGVPTVTFAGDTLIARQGASMLRAAGLGDWVAEDLTAYEMLAVRWAHDAAGLARVRAGLRQQVASTALFDTPRFARTLEAALRGMWQDFESSKKETST